MSVVMITGANRGLGLEFVRQYAADGWEVLAVCRAPDKASNLQEVTGHVNVLQADVAKVDQIGALKQQIGNQPIDILINNAGIFHGWDESLDQIDFDTWAETMLVNVFSPVRVSQALLDNVKASQRKCIANMSSLMGSIGDNSGGGSYQYRSSKAALNQVTKTMSIELKPMGVAAVALHPGWVKTDMGGESAPLMPTESIAGMRKVLEGVTLESTGKFLQYNGKELTW